MGYLQAVTVLALSGAALCAPAPGEYTSFSGLNDCGDQCGCTTDCKDSGPFKFKGIMTSPSECEASCLANSTECPIWIYSAGSKHCWWRTDNVWAPVKGGDITSGCRQAKSADGQACVAGCGACGAAPTAPPAPFTPTNADNMNGDTYYISPTPNGPDVNAKYPINFKDFPGGVEYFDVYSPPITSLYSQVFWTGLDPVDLPADIVARYDGKGMAVVGFEVDQVRKTPEGDVSVPINVAYNHHFESNMIGKKSSLEKLVFDGPDDPRLAKYEAEMGHGVPYTGHYIVHDHAPGNAIPTSQGFGAGNGGEYRMTYHGYAPGFAQVIESPTQFQMTPMQIDTWNRDEMNLTGSKFVQGPVPRNSWAPPTGSPDSLYSGLLECPVTTRIRKLIDASYLASTATCAAPNTAISTAAECFAAGTKLFDAAGGVTIETSAVTSATQPPGCTATASLKDGSITMTFNDAANSTTKCGSGFTQTVGRTQSLVDVQVALDAEQDQVNITLTGPADRWFGVGFHAQAMKDAPWTIIVDGTGKVTERKLADQSPGTVLTTQTKVVSSTVIDGNRTVVLQRAMKGLTPDHYTFDMNSDFNLPFINALGFPGNITIAFHESKMPATLSLMPVGNNGACMCAVSPPPFGQGSGKLQYVQTNQTADVGEGTISFGNKCAPQPRSDLLAMKNPTCDVRSYVGGQSACHHMFSLLDADQEIPWVDQPLVYHQKFRFWVQPYNASYHTNLKRTTWGIASPVEYDVPKCAEGIEGCSQLADGTWIHTIHGTYSGGGKLVAAHFHCHAPTCLEMKMYRCNSSIPVCNSTTGELICAEYPIYGGTGKIKNPKMDEPGYITQPPCLWGSPEFGLEEPVDTTGYTLHTLKTSNANWGHHGEMAWQQMFFY